MTTQIKILNPWQSAKNKLVPLTINVYSNDLIKEVGDYSIYKAGQSHYVYTYKQFAFNELCGLNLEHFLNIVTNATLKPENKMYWLNFRAKETLIKINNLLN